MVKNENAIFNLWPKMKMWAINHTRSLTTPKHRPNRYTDNEARRASSIYIYIYSPNICLTPNRKNNYTDGPSGHYCWYIDLVNVSVWSMFRCGWFLRSLRACFIYIYSPNIFLTQKTSEKWGYSFLWLKNYRNYDRFTFF